MTKLLARSDFREQCFARDRHTCVVCGAPGVDAHHIMERRLFDDGGYYLDNGATLCGTCHLRAEQTVIIPEVLRDRIGAKSIVLPPHLYRDEVYDKWGNQILLNGQRMKGELFFDESVQKVLAPVLHLFTDRVKYPRTYHLPWSHGTDDDRFHTYTGVWAGKEIVVTVKMDGENTTLYRDGLHARSISGVSKPWQSWVRNFHARIAYDIPPGWRICGENLYAKHSIGYDSLPSYFLGFSIWNERNECLSWDDTLDWFHLLDIQPVQTLLVGEYCEKELRDLVRALNPEIHEGYVLRPAASFTYREFRKYVGKYVRPNHVQTSHHWQQELLVKNGLAS